MRAAAPTRAWIPTGVLTGRLSALSGRELVRRLRQHGFEVVSQAGSHVKLRRGESVVIVPTHGAQSLKKPTLLGILRDAGPSPEGVR